MEGEEEEVASSSNNTTYYYLHIFLSIIAIISFWVQSIVTEERLVPALNVISDHFNIPDDVAGATLSELTVYILLVYICLHIAV